MTALYRIARRLVRKALKPALKWLIAWQYKRSEEEVEHLQFLRELLPKKEHAQRRRQVRLQERHNRISGW